MNPYEPRQQTLSDILGDLDHRVLNYGSGERQARDYDAIHHPVIRALRENKTHKKFSKK